MKLDLDKSLIAESMLLAESISNNTIKSLEDKSTVAIERALCRLVGINGGDEKLQIPDSNLIIDFLQKNNLLEMGVLQFFAQQVKQGISLHDIPKIIRSGGDYLITDYNDLLSDYEVLNLLKPHLQNWKNQVNTRKNKRQNRLQEKSTLAYVIVATGDIRQDIIQAEPAVYSGADIIAVIRSSGQSLMDYIPIGETHEGYGGTYATKENFELMRLTLDNLGEKVGKYIGLCNYCSGLCMPEMAVLGSYCGLDVMLNDALYGILFRDINMIRTLLDQHFSRKVLSMSGIIINTGEDNYLTTSDAVESAHTVLASNFINQALAHKSGLPDNQIGLGHAFEMDPDIKNGFLLELSQAQMTRDIFPDCPIKYMPPTKFITGDIFKALVQNSLFNVVGTITNQPIQLLGMMTEGIHTPFPSDRTIALDSFNYIYNNLQRLGEEISFKSDGIIQNRARLVLKKSNELLKEIAEDGLYKALEKGVFANIQRGVNEGKGIDGVFSKKGGYVKWETLLDLMVE